MLFENSYIDLSKTAASGQCFRWQQQGDGTWRIPVLGHVASARRTDDTRIEVVSDFDDDAFWRCYLDCDRDYEYMFDTLVKGNGNKKLGEMYRAAHGVVVLNQPFFEICISSIISQNNNIPRIKSAIESACSQNGCVFPDAEKLLAILRTNDLRVGYRQGYLESFCESVMVGELESVAELAPLCSALHGKEPGSTHRPLLDDVLRKLQSFQGIGPKVAACIALFSLGYIQCVPRDVWIKRAEEQYGVIWDERYAGYQQQLIFYWQQEQQRAKRHKD